MNVRGSIYIFHVLALYWQEDRCACLFVFFFNDTATTEIYTLSLHDALPILSRRGTKPLRQSARRRKRTPSHDARSEEHTSELQSRLHLVCRLLLEKKKNRPCQGNVSRPKASRLPIEERAY